MRFAWILTLIVINTATSLAAAPQHTAELIFPLQEKHVHSSSIVECPNGDLLVCWYHGSGERTANDVVVQGARLKKGATRFGPVFLMADTPGLPDCNPILFVDNQQRLWMFWVAVRANRWERSLLKYRRAEEYAGDGPPNWSWQDAIVLLPGEAFAETLRQGFSTLDAESVLWGEYALPFEQLIVAAAADPDKRQTGWMPRTHPLQLPNGRIILPLYSDGFIQCLMAISDDEGETWQASRPIVGLGVSQPSVVRKQDGTLIAYHRDDGGPPQRVLTATSTDDGLTWSVARDSDIPNPGSSLEVIVANDVGSDQGAAASAPLWVMVFNDTEQRRQRLSVSLSADEGATWPWKRVLERTAGDHGGFSYPSVIQARDGQIHATYSLTAADGTESIKHAAFSIDWIRQSEE